MGHYDSCYEFEGDPTAALKKRVSELEGQLAAQSRATTIAAQTAERALSRLVDMKPVVDQAVLVVDRMSLPPPGLLQAVREYQQSDTGRQS